MPGWRERGQLTLFIAGSLRDLIPDDHVLVRVDQGLDLGWRASVAWTRAVPVLIPRLPFD